MMNERRRKLQTVRVDHYDGQAIYSGNELIYELGGYLGGGAAGVVYEAFSTKTKQHVAIKILNPVGYKLFPSTLLARCIVAIKGKPVVILPSGEEELGGDNGQRSDRRAFSGGNHRMRSNFGAARATTERIRVENVWWLIHPTSKQAIAAFEDPFTGHVRELTLPQCIQVWGELVNQQESSQGRQQADPADLYQEVQVKNQTIKIPRIPKKFIKFAHTRRSIHREISNMSGLEYHENVLRLDEALELVQDSKCTTFLVLELAGGGELFDRIKLDCGTDEETARLYFRQLISGVAFCHNSGVCHRDLKPENLLLADNEEHSTLKIADFGLSAIFAFTDNDAGGGANGNGVDQPAIRRLRSVVGSPHYVAPEVLMDAGQGYDGAKADAWSIGIIVYAMIAGNLPFGKDLLKCVRYDRFRKWSYNTKYSDDDPTDEVEFPTWFFPARFSLELKSLIAQLLYPDACMRLSVEEAQRHVWVRGEQLKKPSPSMLEDDQPPSNDSPLSTPGLPPPSPNSTYKNRMDVAINTLQDGIDLGQQVHPSLLGTVSPQAITRLLAKSPSPHGHAFRCPPSPQQGLRVNKHLAGVVGYMPPVDETSTMSGQTPLSSPHNAKNNENFELELEDDDASVPSTKQLNACNISEATALLKQEALVREATMTTSVNLSGSAAARDLGGNADNESGDVIVPTIHLISQESTAQRHQHRFVSPPLVTGSRDTMPIRLRRNSPPELFLRGFARGRFRELTNGDIGNCGAFEGINILGRSPPLVPQSLVALDEKPGLPFHRTLTEPLAPAENPGDDATSKPVQDEQATDLVPPPSYSDVVARSTRFLTALPARLVLSNIESALAANPCPLPYEYSKVPQNVTIDWDNYQLEVRYAGLLTCTVQVFLFQRGVYLVEFRRGHVDIFQFKRFYEKIRAQISEGLEGGSEQPSPAYRKRNNSISETF
ncbi:hypothetical protein PRIC2_014873 [Phytophthora ramorum]|uniref:non-specific serine/threonine protein kinase n=1 Tax=Phytophthora ramorum TaxID=164328 RepID=H3GMG9_PHYRM